MTATSAVKTWTAPVAKATPSLYFSYDICGDKTWSKMDPDAAPLAADDSVGVQVDEVPGGFRMSCICFYSPEGRCELVLTGYPLERTLAIFGRLLDVESDAESGLIEPVTIAG